MDEKKFTEEQEAMITHEMESLRQRYLSKGIVPVEDELRDDALVMLALRNELE